MDTVPILQFLTDRYNQAETQEDRTDISTLYWSILDYSLHGIESFTMTRGDTLISPVLN